jgi:hypothetical protein
MKVGRFQVMATLQAARARELGLSETRAKSWGLNRAIFYAAAKRGFKHPARAPGKIGAEQRPVAKAGKVYYLGNEMAYTARKGNRNYRPKQTSSDRSRPGLENISRLHGMKLLRSFAKFLRTSCCPRISSSAKCIVREGTNLLRNGRS